VACQLVYPRGFCIKNDEQAKLMVTALCNLQFFLYTFNYFHDFLMSHVDVTLYESAHGHVRPRTYLVQAKIACLNKVGFFLSFFNFFGGLQKPKHATYKDIFLTSLYFAFF